MKKLICTFGLISLALLVLAQPNFTANDVVPEYETPFLLSINPNFNGSQWSDQNLATIAAGDSTMGVPGVGIQSFRVPLPENFLDFWGYDIRIDAFQHYENMGLKDNTVFLEAPADQHRDTTVYCPGESSVMFANLYEPIWDNGANGTPVNDENYAALYIYKTVQLYGDYVRFWEIWNEPDLDNQGNGWKPRDIDGNWYDNVPDPCEIQIGAPVFHYNRLLRISYEVIKTLDPDAYITVGGLGYESFLDVILRYTDNPDGGQVTPEYPLKGGAYFDVLSYHVYPHINGSLKIWDNSINGFAYFRHSDAAVGGSLSLKDKFENILFEYGYDGQTYPEKLFILTETTVPRKKLEDFIGSDASARNYAIKVQVAAHQNDIRQIALYQLADQNSFSAATSWLEMSGLYSIISGSQPYDVTPNESGIGCRTTTQMLEGKIYHQGLTDNLNLSNDIGGGAFVDEVNRDTLFVLWAKTKTDESEASSASFSFPQNFGYGAVEKMKWDFSVTNEVDFVSAQNVQLTGDPLFIKGIFDPSLVNSNPIDLTKEALVQPNPFDNFFTVRFELEEMADVRLEIFDKKGVKVYEDAMNELGIGEHNFLVEDAPYFASAMYFGRLTISGKRPWRFKVMKIEE